MPYDPSLPLANTEINADQMRVQLQGLAAMINAVAAGTVTPAQLTAAINAALAAAASNSSANSNSVATLGQTADSYYNQTQMQQVLDKLDELINTLRR